MDENVDQPEIIDTDIENNDEPNQAPKPPKYPVQPIEDHIPKLKKSKKTPLIITIAVLILLIGAGLVWYFGFNNKPANNKKASTPATKSKTVAKVAGANAELTKFINSTSGETWLPKPVAIAQQGYFTQTFESNSLSSPPIPALYYQVGKRGDNTIVMAGLIGFMGYSFSLFEKDPNGNVAYISRPSSLATYNDTDEASFAQQLTANITIKKDIHYDSLSIPNQLVIDDNGTVVSPPNYPTLGGMDTPGMTAPVVTGQTITVVKQFGGSTVTKAETVNAETKLVSIIYYIKTPLNTSIGIRYEPINTDLSGYSWEKGISSTGKASMHPIARGCGGMGSSVTRSDVINDNDVQVAGKAGDGKVVYEFKDVNNSLLQKAFTEFKDFSQYDTNSGYANLSIADFVRMHGVILYKDVSGQWFVYVRDDLAPAYGCAKPVVYLYPTKIETVNVKVGANVKVSDPYYNPQIGWTAIASPSGQLIVNGTGYNSLFWEGPGIGQYPQITEGTVVKKQNAVSMIRHQLTQQGLNNNEINDFVDYWQDKIPTQKYVRLTWFNTAQMNELAPLYITPKPNTVIRVFLDMNGLDNPISIASQNLKLTPRTGFTVVEWGGLSSRKLY